MWAFSAPVAGLISQRERPLSSASHSESVPPRLGWLPTFGTKALPSPSEGLRVVPGNGFVVIVRTRLSEGVVVFGSAPDAEGSRTAKVNASPRVPRRKRRFRAREVFIRSGASIVPPGSLNGFRISDRVVRFVACSPVDRSRVRSEPDSTPLIGPTAGQVTWTTTFSQLVSLSVLSAMTLSMPAPQLTVSISPSRTLTWSFPSPARTTSLPLPPVSTSLPA